MCVDLIVILFMLDEISYLCEFVLLVGVWLCLCFGLLWWFYDSLEGMCCFCEMVMEIVGFYNIVGFNDDMWVFCLILVCYDVVCCVDCVFLVDLVVIGCFVEDEVVGLVYDLIYGFVKKVYCL